MMIVIADDITGAAEIAGIAFSYGLTTQLVTDFNGAAASADVMVVATDTRSLSREEAVEVTERLCSLLPVGTQVFKKTDSALRGHIMAELSVLLEETACQKALFMPANPSRGRVIQGGVYLIDGIPLDETDFSFDPEFPAFSSVMTERFPEAASCSVEMPDATSFDDVLRLVERAGEDTLLAGAADLFEAWLRHKGLCRLPAAPYSLSPDNLLMVCGSTQSVVPDMGVQVIEMPKTVYEGTGDATAWAQQVLAAYVRHSSLILSIPHHHLTGKAVAVRLRGVMAAVVGLLVAVRCPHSLLLEGGATAHACLQALGWNRFVVEAELAPGAIALKSMGQTTVVLKPGSYPWGPLFDSD